MENCLITKLKGVVDNDNLLKVGELSIKIFSEDAPAANNRTMSVVAAKNLVIKIVGDGYFTDSTLITNKGKELSVKANVLTKFIYSNGDYNIVIGDKYSLVDFNTYEVGVTNTLYQLHIEDFKYSKGLHDLYITTSNITGNMFSTKDLPNIYRVYFNNSNVEGNLELFKYSVKLDSLNVGGKITGDISVLSNLNLRECIIANKYITGDISVFENYSNLEILNISNSMVYGDISVLKKLPKLKMLSCSNNNKLSGNLGDVPDKILSINNASSFVWTGTDRKNILGIWGATITSGLDQLFIDMAKLEMNSSGVNMYEINILVRGTRTSASDAAIETLQTKGMTITVNPIQ